MSSNLASISSVLASKAVKESRIDVSVASAEANVVSVAKSSDTKLVLKSSNSTRISCSLAIVAVSSEPSIASTASLI